jgi:uncharacterized RDD family membrane protein YckC
MLQWAYPVRVLRALRHRDFRLLWTGQAVSLLGDGIYLVAIAWLVYDISNEPGALAIVGFAVWCWLNIRYVLRNGQSIGKKLVGIKVVRADGTPASLGRIFWLRNALNAAISIVPLYGLIDILFIFGSSNQCLHDKIADTIVVKT